jgi:hypothetical protein
MQSPILIQEGLSRQELKMKKKDQTLKKLNLSTETLRNLEHSHLEAAKGAAPSDKTNCLICSYTCP